MRRWLSPLVFLTIAGVGCRSTSSASQPVLVLIDHDGVDATAVEIEPMSAVERVTTTPRRLIVEVHPSRLSGALSLRIPGACPLQLSLDGTRLDRTLTAKARPYLELGPDRSEIGFDSRFEIEVAAGCPEAERGTVSWKQVEGVPLRAVSTQRRGFEYSARTPRREELLPRPSSGEIVPVSPRTSGRAVLQATLVLPNGTRVDDRISVAAVSRARGLPNVPVDATVLLGGEGWSWVQKPPDAAAQLASDGGLTWFRPRVSGRWLLADPDGNELSLQSAFYSALPLDCTRGGCHDDRPFGTAGKMGSVMSRGLAGHLGPFYDPGCALACHAVGEPGIDDGGFDHVARELDFPLNAHTLPSTVPPALQRLSNVGCLACHGPGTIPEPSARWSILSADVCAYCHDQPPSYSHVESWKQGAMSRADRGLTARSDPACVACHTTWGFLHDEHAETPPRQPPAEHGVGIACAACHDVHQTPATRGLVRHRELPPAAVGLSESRLGSSGICFGCHAPSRDEPLPSASVVAILAGSYGFNRQGRELNALGAHATAENGCLACHGERHDFRASPSRCDACHDTKPRDTSLQKRARALWSELAERGAVEPLSATTHVKLQLSRANRMEKLAAYNVALVLLDSGADVHNPSYAGLLLKEASDMLGERDGSAR